MSIFSVASRSRHLDCAQIHLLWAGVPFPVLSSHVYEEHDDERKYGIHQQIVILAIFREARGI